MVAGIKRCCSLASSVGSLDDVYNRKPIHSSLGYLTPAEFERQWLEESSVLASRK